MPKCVIEHGIPGAGKTIEPFFREAGTGPRVVCVHSNASTSGQSRGLMDLLAPRFRLFAPDSYDAGKSPHWPLDRVIHLRDEVGLIEPVLTRVGSPLALVGHSYGAAVALIAALADPGRVRAMALYEPTLFALLDAETRAPNEAEGIRHVVAEAGVAFDAGNQDAAAERFIDYWMGPGTWTRTPEQRKLPIAASVTNVRRWGHALFTEPTPLKAFRSLDVPVLYMVVNPSGFTENEGRVHCHKDLAAPACARGRASGPASAGREFLTGVFLPEADKRAYMRELESYVEPHRCRRPMRGSSARQ